jgi:ElaB/YqjD/DUF883 family membrane-anchored ribosome-binding protein
METKKIEPQADSSGNQDYKTKNQGLNSLEHFSRESGKAVGDMASNLARSTNQYVRSSRDFVRDNPTTGVAIAAAAGALVGSLVTMSMRSRRS